MAALIITYGIACVQRVYDFALAQWEEYKGAEKAAAEAHEAAVEATNPLHYETLSEGPYITGEYTDLLVYRFYSENAEVVDKENPHFTFELKRALKGQGLNKKYAYNPENGPYRGASLTEKEAESQPFSSTPEADDKLVGAIDKNQAREFLIKYLTEKKTLLTAAQNCDITSVDCIQCYVIKTETYVELRSRQILRDSSGTPAAEYSLRRNGSADTNLWDVNGYSPLPNFMNSKEAVFIPYSAECYTCTKCNGSKQQTCDNQFPPCNGDMTPCNNSFHKNRKGQRLLCNERDDNGRPCNKCNGKGFVTCHVCRGTRTVGCKKCGATGGLYSTEFIFRLHVNLIDYKIVKGDIPNEDLPDAEVIRISETKGKSIFEKTCGKVAAPVGYSAAVDAACAASIETANSNVNQLNGYQHHQRVTVTKVPLFMAKASDTKQNDKFFRWYIVGSADQSPAVRLCGDYTYKS